MNRRHFLAGSIALAGQQKLLRSMGTLSIGGQCAPSATSPQNLLSTTYPEAFLVSKLIPVAEWHPYPRCSQRGPWQAVPADVRTAFVERAQDDQKAGWKPLLATTFLNFKRNGDQSIYDAAWSARRTQLQRLVLAECMEGQGRFVDDIGNGVWTICEETFWGLPEHMYMQRAGVGLPDVTEPIVDLFAAETVATLAWSRYLLGEQLDQISPLIGKRIQIEGERRILRPARDRDDFWWMGLTGRRRLNNWTPWINSNLLVANLLLEDDPKLRVREMVRITKSLDAYLNQYSPDAGEEEGPVYFGRSPMSYFECVSMLESATGNSTNILSNPFIDAMGRYILNAHIAGDDYIAYGDAHVKADPDGDLIYRFGKAVHDGQLEAYGAYCAAKEGRKAALGMSLSRSVPAVLEATESRSARREDVLIRDAWYPCLGLMTAREQANSPDGMYVACLAGNNGRSHGHNDTGSFTIYQDGDPVAIDVGVEAYTAKTFSPDRYSIWTMQSAYHNLPTIGGVMQHAGAGYRATGLKYESNDDRATLSFNLAATYPKEAGVKLWMRTVTLDRVSDKVTVEENFELERPVPVSLSVMTPRVATVDANGSITLKLAAGEGKPSLLKFSGAQIQPVVEKIPLTDQELRRSWGDEIYRVLLNSKQPVAKGSWSYEFTRV